MGAEHDDVRAGAERPENPFAAPSSRPVPGPGASPDHPPYADYPAAPAPGWGTAPGGGTAPDWGAGPDRGTKPGRGPAVRPGRAQPAGGPRDDGGPVALPGSEHLARADGGPVALPGSEHLDRADGGPVAFPGSEHVDRAAVLGGPGYTAAVVRNDPLAVAALVLGLLAVVPGVGLAAVVCGHLALRRQDGYAGGRGLAVAGLALGYTVTALWVLLLLAIWGLGESW